MLSARTIAATGKSLYAMVCMLFLLFGRSACANRCHPFPKEAVRKVTSERASVQDGEKELTTGRKAFELWSLWTIAEFAHAETTSMR